MSSAKPSAKRSSTPLRRGTGRRPSKTAAPLTSECIARDLAAFRKGGGRIEVLGNTRVLTRVDVPEDAKDDKPARKATAKAASKRATRTAPTRAAAARTTRASKSTSVGAG